jgi:hypothetical protein
VEEKQPQQQKSSGESAAEGYTVTNYECPGNMINYSSITGVILPATIITP